MNTQTNDRAGDWFSTQSGIQFWPLDPREDEICIDDIAHSLAMQCRYGGHTRYHYSVAQHSFLLSLAVPPEHALCALLHDASEAYLSDVIRPIKRHLHGYDVYETRLWKAIARKFGLPEQMPLAVIEADDRILNNERDALLPKPPAKWLTDPRPLENVRITELSHADVRTLFMWRFNDLTGVL